MATEAQILSREMILPAYKAADIYVPIRHLYICRERSTNQPFLRKTNPISEKSNERKYLITNGL